MERDTICKEMLFTYGTWVWLIIDFCHSWEYQFTTLFKQTPRLIALIRCYAILALEDYHLLLLSACPSNCSLQLSECNHSANCFVWSIHQNCVSSLEKRMLGGTVSNALYVPVDDANYSSFNHIICYMHQKKFFLV